MDFSDDEKEAEFKRKNTESKKAERESKKALRLTEHRTSEHHVQPS